MRVTAAVKGDRAAAEALLSELLPRVRNLVRYFLRNDDIDDTVQDSLIAILRGLPTYRGEGALVSWSDRIVARVAIEAARRKRQESARAAAEDPEQTQGAAAPDYASRRRLVAALDKLSSEMREALVLHHVLEMSVPEIATELEVPAETIRSRLRNGRATLRASMEKA